MGRSVSLRKKALPSRITDHVKLRGPVSDWTSFSVTVFFFVLRRSAGLQASSLLTECAAIQIPANDIHTYIYTYIHTYIITAPLYRAIILP